MNNVYRFYDTCALINLGEQVQNDEQPYFFISSVTQEELENIKSNKSKDEHTKFQVKKAIKVLNENKERYKLVIYGDFEYSLISERLSENNINPDSKIIACAYSTRDTLLGDQNTDDDIIFVSDDIFCRTIAERIFKLNVCGSDCFISDNSEYTGYKEITINSDEELAYFYEHISQNTYELLVNQYLILKNNKNEIIDCLKWSGNEYENLKFPTIKSSYFGNIKPYNGDIYQKMVLNSLSSNQVTMIKGSAGTGKSYLAIGYLMWLLEKRKIEKIIVFCNTIATINSAKLGYYPGTKDEKLIDSSIGNMLSAKLGDAFGLEQMISQGKIQLLPLSDIRGFDTNGMCAGVYITEAQNMDVSLMKLALQRIGEDSICIIDGDYNTQCDMPQYEGSNNGMRRMSKIFRGQDFYGEIELKNIYRSKIALIADKM